MNQNKNAFFWETIMLDEFLDLANDTKLVHELENKHPDNDELTQEYNLRKVLDSSYSIKGQPKNWMTKTIYGYGIYELHERSISNQKEFNKSLKFITAFLNQDRLPHAKVVEQFILWLKDFHSPKMIIELLKIDYFTKLFQHKDLNKSEIEDIREEVFYLYHSFVQDLLKVGKLEEIAKLLPFGRVVEQIEYS